MEGDFVAVIPAGGSGTRLWPLSRSQEPKFLLDLLGTGKSLLVDTVERLAPLVGIEGIVVVTGEVHQGAVSAQLPELPARNLLIEPSPKNSAAAVGLAAHLLNDENPDLILGFFAADHVIGNEEAFRAIIGTAISAARGNSLVTIGITPNEPSSAYGYIKVGAGHDSISGVNAVLEFVEKPSFVDAEKFLESGDYVWNAGIFVGRASAIVHAFRDFAPELHQRLSRIMEIVRAGQDFREEWKSLPALAFDYVVAEPAAQAGRFLVVPGEFGWRDIGDFAALAGAQGSTVESDVLVLGDSAKVHPRDSTGIVIGASGRIITVLGMKDVVIVDTPDALLVTTKDHAQEVKQVVDLIRENGLSDVL